MAAASRFICPSTHILKHMENDGACVNGDRSRMRLLELVNSAIDAWLSGAGYVAPFEGGFRLRQTQPFQDLIHSWSESWRESMRGDGRAQAVCAAIELEIKEYGKLRQENGKHYTEELVGAYLRGERLLAQAAAYKFIRQASRERPFRKQGENEQQRMAERDMLRRIIYCIKLDSPELAGMISAMIEKAEYHNECERRELEKTILTLNDRKFTGIDLDARMKEALLALKGKCPAAAESGRQEIHLEQGKWRPKSRWHKVHSHKAPGKPI